jgi:hypothetical protein
VDNEDIFSQVNTLVKMAKKRALVDATLSAGRLSNVFTQDIEDMEPISGEIPTEVSRPVEKPLDAPPDLKSLEFKNPGEFYTACLKYLKLSKTKADAEISGYDLTETEARVAAWQQLLVIYGHRADLNN